MLSQAQATLKLDFDMADPPDLAMIFRKLERAGYREMHMTQSRSPSGTGWHVTIDVDPMPKTAMEVVALQAICGSDPWREAMQMHRARAMGKRNLPAHMRDAWNVLYVPDSRRARGLVL